MPNEENGEFVKPHEQVYLKSPRSEESERIITELEKKYPGLERIYTLDILPRLRDAFTQQPIDVPVIAAVARQVSTEEWERDFKRYHLYQNPQRDDVGLIIVGRGVNESKGTGISGRHGEIVAIEDAEHTLNVGEFDPNMLLISSVEPCVQCVGGLILARGQQLIYCASQDDLRDQDIRLGGQLKRFRTMSPQYHVEKLLQQEAPDSIVQGGYRREEILSVMGINEAFQDADRLRNPNVKDDLNKYQI